LLRLYVFKGDFEKAVQLVEPIEQGIKAYAENIHAGRSISMNYYIAYAYLGLKEYITALRWINKIISGKTDLSSDLLCFSRLLNLILHIELDNQLQLEYVFKSTYSYFMKRERLFKLEGCFLRFMKKNTEKMSASKQKDLFILLKDELSLLLTDPYEYRALEYFDFISWLVSKIENKPFMQVVQEKNN
jgi:hypothetical protein